MRGLNLILNVHERDNYFANRVMISEKMSLYFAHKTKMADCFVIAKFEIRSVGDPVLL